VPILSSDKAAYSPHQIDRSPYGDGRAAERIVDWMLRQGWQAETTPDLASPSKLREAA